MSAYTGSSRLPQDFQERVRRKRNRHLRRLAAELPYAIHDERHGLGFILKPVKPRGCRASEPNWYLVNYGNGVECRVLEGEAGRAGSFSWENIGKYIADHERVRAAAPWSLRPRTLWRHIFKMWD
jgi:hypothetical protein